MQRFLCGKSVLQHVLRGFDKRVDLLERSVDVGRDAEAVVAQARFFGIIVSDSRDDDAVFVPKVRDEFIRIDAVDRNHG